MMTINMIFAAALIGAAVPSPSPGAEAAVLHAESEFGGAVAANDTGKIKKLTADDWQIIDGDGHIISRQTFLGVIGSGTLKHSALSSSDQTVRVYGDAAIVTGLAKSAGTYAGSAFSTDEVSTDFWIRTKNGWRCVLTQLTTLKP
jgi:ketosteroid isomerase-like protein